jgi:hypothetical protein
MVYALPFGGAHDMGPQDGLVGARRQPPAPEAAPAAVRSSQMLIRLPLSLSLLPVAFKGNCELDLITNVVFFLFTFFIANCNSFNFHLN